MDIVGMFLVSQVPYGKNSVQKLKFKDNVANLLPKPMVQSTDLELNYVAL